MTKVVLQLREVPDVLFNRLDCADVTPNRLTIRVQPNEGVEILMLAGRIGSVARFPQTARLRRRLRRWRPDIVHAHENTDPALLAVCAGVPRVITVHDPSPHPGLRA